MIRKALEWKAFILQTNLWSGGSNFCLCHDILTRKNDVSGQLSNIFDHQQISTPIYLNFDICKVYSPESLILTHCNFLRKTWEKEKITVYYLILNGVIWLTSKRVKLDQFIRLWIIVVYFSRQMKMILLIFGWK